MLLTTVAPGVPGWGGDLTEDLGPPEEIQVVTKFLRVLVSLITCEAGKLSSHCEVAGLFQPGFSRPGMSDFVTP